MKINQDIDVINQKLPLGLKLFCVSDGHGTNGHLVAAFIRKKLQCKIFI
jgi:serine/threonine protein phosphatase PrpC